MVLVVSSDEIKKELTGYSPEKAEFFHTESAKIADQNFENALRESKYNKVILLCGGSASGKTEFLATQLIKKQAIVLDATLSTELGARTKISKILKSNKVPVIYAVIPDDLNRAFIAFLNRDRKFSDTYFYRTHSGSRKVLLYIALNYPSVKITIVQSSYTNNQQLQFTQLKFDHKKQTVDYLTELQLTENDIISLINSKL